MKHCHQKFVLSNRRLVNNSTPTRCRVDAHKNCARRRRYSKSNSLHVWSPSSAVAVIQIHRRSMHKGINRACGARAAIWRRFIARHKEPVNVISKSHQNRSAFSMTAAITTAKDGRLGADT
jgi:hypothetical protein